ncbi:MAG TPA: serine--tRNA ligase [Saprospiraceae bacterium]|nr:serine--tRNA ligase [Saprospiraceae bacterium]
MLELQVLHQQKESIIERLGKRNMPVDPALLINEVIQLDLERKDIQTSLDAVLARVNQSSKEIGMLFQMKRNIEAENMKNQVSSWKQEIRELEERSRDVKQKLEEALLGIPNAPHPLVPGGKSPDENLVYKNWPGSLPQPEPGRLPHWEIANEKNIFDLKLGVKVTGAGFPLFRGKGARLQRALIQFFLDEAVAAGYEEVVPPLLVNPETARGTGQLPDKEGQMYFINEDNLYLIPTAEVPVTNIYRDTMINPSDFPIKLTAYTPCFRREAGSYGADVKGLNRVHQFDKVEIVQIERPEKSYERLDEMIAHVEQLLEKLELPYRILRLCGGDMGFASAMTYDFEVYSAVQKRWLEVSSVSNFETFQTNRMKIRFKNEKGKSVLAHTLNGSALALARIIAAILENHQTSEGIIIPEVLRDYTGFSVI